MTVEEERQVVARGYGQWLRLMIPQQRRDKTDEDGGFEEGDSGFCEGRETAYRLARFIAGACWADRIDVDPAQLRETIRRAAKFIVRRQAPDGRIDLGGSYSPNEAGFPVPGLVAAYKHASKRCPDLFDEIKDDLKQYITRAAEAVLSGAAYTANHRWTAASAPLAAAHSLWPDQRYLDKINDYLADGIDCDEDGFWYEERSPNYNIVANEGMLVLADCLDRPDLLQPVLRNFQFLLRMVQPNGENDSSFSHRQDRAVANRVLCSYRTARRAAQLTGDGRLTTLAIGAMQPVSELVTWLVPVIFEIDEHPEPMPAAIPLETEYEKYFARTGLARMRHGPSALTLAVDHGGHFYTDVRDQWGGPRHSDDWFHFMHDDIVIQSIHLAPAGMYAIQPRMMERLGADSYRLSGEFGAWKHTLHFRPGSPLTDMPWDVSHHEEIEWKRRGIRLKMHCIAPHALIASLNIWLRPGVEVIDGDGAARAVVAGEMTSLRGGGPVVIRSPKSSVTISGLPAASHRVKISPGQPIPSVMPRICGAISLGLRPPIDLNLQLSF
jgi:hypothetical protein